MTRIAVVGSINLDLIVATDRIPRPGETVLGGPLSYRTGGKGANQAVAAARYGAEVALLGATGDDDFGLQLRAAIEQAGVSTSYVRVAAGTPSGVALIAVDADGDNAITVSPGANAVLGVGDVASFGHEIEAADAVQMQLEIAPAVVEAVAATARAAGATVVLNAAPFARAADAAFSAVVAQTDVLVVNETEALGLGAAGSTWLDRAESLRRLGPTTVVVTLGAQGAVAVDQRTRVVQPAFPVQVVDAIGAGDAFCAALTAEIAVGSALADAVRLACAVGALAATSPGAQAGVQPRSAVADWVRGQGG
ncbi:MAG: ribokinase [Bifidobacteriaceae bacterium]|jgi:ribokinase|nr:ribokinase [Bifidobacteriaceae bacterium]